MGLPSVKINFSNGALGSIAPSSDGVLGLICTAVAVSTTFTLKTPYKITSIADLEALGVTAANNPRLYAEVTNFYLQAGTGSKIPLWVFGVSDTTTLAQMAAAGDLTMSPALLIAAQGEIRGLLFARKPAAGYTPTVTAGIDADCYAAATAAQALCGYAQNTFKTPIFAIIEGRSYTGVPANLTDMTASTLNRVAILIGDTASDTGNAAIGLLGGKIASIPVQRNIGRVKDGALAVDNAYVKATAVALADVESLHNKGFITFRAHVGRNGVFFSNDPLCTTISDDYHRLALRRVADKAFRIAYVTLLNNLLDELPVLSDGTLQPAISKNWETQMENAISLSMTANGELSADAANANDRGVKCYINPSQNVISTSKITGVVRIRPFGYADYLEFSLGFETVS